MGYSVPFVSKINRKGLVNHVQASPKACNTEFEDGPLTR